MNHTHTHKWTQTYIDMYVCVYIYTIYTHKLLVKSNYQYISNHSHAHTHRKNNCEIRNHSNTHNKDKHIKYQRQMRTRADYGKHTLRKREEWPPYKPITD